MYECLDKTDGKKLRSILNLSVDLANEEDIKVRRRKNNIAIIRLTLDNSNLGDYNGRPFLFMS
jgi:hypothetical protein